MILEVQPHQVEVAKAIADYGFMAVLTAFTLVAMFIMFKFFMSTLKKLLEKQDGAYLYETPMEQIRVLQSALFDLAKHEVLSQMYRIFTENNLHDKEHVRSKIKDVLTNIHNDRNSKLDNFKYHGLKLSEFTYTKWIDRITDVCMKQIYMNEKEFSHKRTFSALDVAYNRVKIEFYNNIIAKA